MKSLKKCVTFIIITLLLLGLSHPIMAEDSSGENQGNGEDTQNDTTPLLGDPMRNGGGNQTLTITISSGSDPIEDETWAFLFIKDYEGIPYEGELNTDSDKVTLDTSVRNDEEDAQSFFIRIPPLEANETFHVYVPNLNVNQEYAFEHLPPPGNLRSDITYLCRGGRVKNSTTYSGFINRVECAVFDENDPNSATDSQMINKLNLKISIMPEKERRIPAYIEVEHLKGAIASSCSSQYGFSDTNAPIFFTTNYYDVIDMAAPYYHYSVRPVYNSIHFKDAKEKEGELPVIYYEGEGYTHVSKELSDNFIIDGTIEFPFTNSYFEPNAWNQFFAYTIPQRGDTQSYAWMIMVYVDEDLEFKDLKIYLLKDGKRTLPPEEALDNLPDEYLVDRIERFQKDYRTAIFNVRNSSPSQPDTEFEYEITFFSRDDSAKEYEVRKNWNDVLGSIRAGQPYTFTMKHNDYFDFIGLDTGTTYTIKQKKEEGFVSTVATSFNSHDYIDVDLEEKDDYYLTDTIELLCETVYQKVDQLGDPPPVLCPPKDDYGIYYGMQWTNTAEEDLKIILKKVSDIPEEELADFGYPTLEGAEFTLIDPNGVRRVGVTNEEGVVEFKGLDKNSSYVIEETKAPNGYRLSENIYYYAQNDDEWSWAFREARSYNYRGYTPVNAFFNPIAENVYEKTVEEHLAYTELEVRKALLLDESRYDGPLVEIKNFVFIPDTNDYREVEYRDYVWPRSYFEDVEDVEFVMTLDKDPENPRYTYRATTDSSGRARFKRDLPLRDGEPEVALYAVFYGDYTIKEVNVPDGMSKIPDQHITIKPPTEPYIETNAGSTNRTVMKAVNLPTKGDLKISKTVQGSKGDKNLNFNFTITLKDGEGVELPNEYNYEGSKQGSIKSGGTIQLKHNESVTIKNLPAGTQYEVVEEMVPNYETTVNGQKDNKSSGTIEDKKVKEVKYVNTSGDVPTPTPTPTPTNPPKTDPPTRYEVPNTYDPTNLKYGWILLLGLFGIYISKRLLNEDNS